MAQPESAQPQPAPEHAPICFVPRDSEVPEDTAAALKLVPESAEKLRNGKRAVLEFQSGQMIFVADDAPWTQLVSSVDSSINGEGYTIHGFNKVLSLLKGETKVGLQFQFEDGNFVFKEALWYAMYVKNYTKGPFKSRDSQLVVHYAVEGENQKKRTQEEGRVNKFSINEDGTISPVLEGQQWVLADGGLLPTHVFKSGCSCVVQ